MSDGHIRDQITAQAARRAHFRLYWDRANPWLRRRLQEFASVPTERNECFFTGFLAALMDINAVTKEEYTYWMHLTARMSTDKNVRDLVAEVAK